MTPEEAHIVAQARLRTAVATAIAHVWGTLPDYNTPSVGRFLAIVVPLVLAAQRQSAILTNSFLASAIGRPPVAIDVSKVIGAAVRAGTPPEVVYRRPFVQTWTMLAEHKPWTQAVSAGLARAQSAAAMDVQNTMRHTLRLVGDADPLILGYRRIPDADACEFCKLIAGRRYLTSELQPVHNHCGCGVGVITAANRGDFTGNSENDLSVTANGVHAAVVEHGELGPLLVDGNQHFTALAA